MHIFNFEIIIKKHECSEDMESTTINRTNYIEKRLNQQINWYETNAKK